ncbi:hypothetical protein M949_1112 [Riemerella anatipestifer CH3]|nr:hypothetical protein M949_1112 [Riemerella anatipestifer CH3]
MITSSKFLFIEFRILLSAEIRVSSSAFLFSISFIFSIMELTPPSTSTIFSPILTPLRLCAEESNFIFTLSKFLFINATVFLSTKLLSCFLFSISSLIELFKKLTVEFKLAPLFDTDIIEGNSLSNSILILPIFSLTF